MQPDSNGLEILDRDKCLRLLSTAVLGRVAVTADALPRVLPITFRVVGDQILFRTSPGYDARRGHAGIRRRLRSAGRAVAGRHQDKTVVTNLLTELRELD